MPRFILFNKPYLVLCQFTDPGGRPTLADYISIPNIYAAGRLDYDSEGLLLLTDDGSWQHRLTDPRYKLPKTYWVQVEGVLTAESLSQLANGLTLNDGKTRPTQVRQMSPPAIWERHPPIRTRRAIPTSWLTITLTEGRKRQVRRMTAAVGYPTLRLIRVAIGSWELSQMQPGEWREIDPPLGV